MKVRFGSTLALDAVDLTVKPGAVHAILGENGAGKSTLMKVLSGAVKPNEGTMLIDGNKYQPNGPADGRAKGIAMIYQELTLTAHQTVAENISLGVEPSKSGILDRKVMREKAHQALSELGHANIDVDAAVGRLSISAQQLVEIARSTVLGCNTLILDEPTSSLSHSDTQQLFNLIRRLKSQGLSIIYISHFLEEVREICDSFTVLRDGRTVSTGSLADTTDNQLVSQMLGKSVQELYPRSQRTAGDAVLEISSLIGDKIKGIDLTIRRGEVVGIAGLLGSGRTELVRAIFGLDSVKSGRIKISSHLHPTSSGHQATSEASQPRSSNPTSRWRQKIGFVSENRKEEGLALSMTIAENMTLPSTAKCERLGLIDGNKLSELAVTWIEKLSIRCRSANEPVGNLSGGNQQKVALARLLFHDVDLFLLDEPTRGIDVGSKMQIYELINELAAKGKSVLMISSYLPELLGVCDRIAVMKRGRLRESHVTSETSEHELLLEATTGTTSDESEETSAS